MGEYSFSKAQQKEADRIATMPMFAHYNIKGIQLLQLIYEYNGLFMGMNGGIRNHKGWMDGLEGKKLKIALIAARGALLAAVNYEPFPQPTTKEE